MENIVLIGMMGCGKTTISNLLSKELSRPLIDIDEYLVDKYDMIYLGGAALQRHRLPHCGT